MGGGTKYSQSTATQQLPSYLQGAYENIIGKAQGTAATPYSAYTGGVNGSGYSADQQTAFGNIASMWGSSDPQFNNASTALSSSMVPTYNEVGAYMNPYIQGVVNPMMDVMQEQNQRQQQGVVGNAIAKGAMGGNRVGVAQGELARQQKLSDSQTLGQLYQQGYSGAMSAAQADKAAKLQAAGQYAGLGQTQMETGLAQAGAQLGAGTQQQQFDYQQYLNQLAFPYQQQSWLASIAGGLAPSAGGTTTESKPDGNSLTQMLGMGLQAASLFSDKRMKEGVVPVGKSFDGQTIYRYRYKGQPQTHLGFMAQETKKDHPEAVGKSGGMMTVDYEKATEDAADRGEFAFGGVVPHMAMGGIPYSNDNGMWPSYAAGFGAMPGANDNGQFGSYIPKVAQIGGGGHGFPTISADQPEEEFQFTDDMKKGAGNIKSLFAPKTTTRMPALYADGGVVGRYGYAGGGVPMVAPMALFDETFAAAGLPDELKRKINAEALRRDPGRIAPARPAAVSAIDAVSPLDNANLGLGQGNGEVDLAYSRPSDTLPDASVERFAPGRAPADRVRVADAGGNGVVPFNRGEQFTTAAAPGYSQNLMDAFQSFGRGEGFNFAPDVNQGLMSAGAAMMASKRPGFLSGVGEGIQTGVESWTARQALERENAAQRAANAQTGSSIALQAEQAAQTAAETARTEQLTQIDPWEASFTPGGAMMRDKRTGAPPTLYPWGTLMPNGEVADPSMFPDGGAGAATPEIFDLSVKPGTAPADGRLWSDLGGSAAISESTDMRKIAAEKAQAALASKQLLAEMQHNMQNLPDNGWLAQGTGFDNRREWAKAINTASTMAGLTPWLNPDEVAAAEDLNKLTTRLGAELNKGFGSDNAASIVMQAISAVPGGANTKDGANKIMAGLEAMNQRAVDWNEFLTNWAAAGNQTTLGAIEVFNKRNPPELYALSAVVPTEAMQMLRSDPSPEAIREFNELFGHGKDVSRYVIGR